MRDVYVQGVAIDIGWEDARYSLSEWVFDICDTALKNASTPRATLDSIVITAHDLVDGRGLCSMLTATAAGAYLKDEIRVSDDSGVSVLLGDSRVRSGHSDTVIVAGWGRASEGDQLAISRLLFEPFYTRPLGLTELSVSAARAHAMRVDPESLSVAAERRAASALSNPRGVGDRGIVAESPDAVLGSAELPHYADVRAAIILSSTPSPIRIAGIGQCTGAYSIGERNLLADEALATAARAALREADAEPDDISLWELDGRTLFDEAIAAEAVGAAAAGEGMSALGSREDINASGGSAAGYCWPGMGLVRTVEAILRLKESDPGGRKRRLAMATGASVLAGQGQTAIVLEMQ